MDQFLGEIAIVGFNYAPVGWALCNGQILNVQQNAALFSLLGNKYGGNGSTTFGLPNLQGRVPVGLGQGPGLSNYGMGATGGVETVQLQAGQQPSHNHTMAGAAGSGRGNVSNPSGKVPAGATTLNQFAPAGSNPAQMAPLVQAGSDAHENRQPYLVLNFVIALTGLYPIRP
jgi:microcystin-dependent protein